jgi:hypothetical protein
MAMLPRAPVAARADFVLATLGPWTDMPPRKR